ncbi:GntR family transcriptional regulator [Kitasatospora sp. NPDC098663]|uniref:GntR family transcriptional regulator n=1 Tax=Kitasatospora sp. NPDC098663 TaxID=3364096 RepID=UPI0038291500
MSDRDRPDRPTFRVVADQIRAAIRSGTYAPGSTLPPDVRLAEDFGTNRNIVGKAIVLLTAEGFVSKAPNQRGATVTRIVAKFRRDSEGSFNAAIQALGMAPESRVRVSRAAPPATVADILGVPAGSESAVVHALHVYADATPVLLVDSYIPVTVAQAAGLETEDTGAGGMLPRLAEAGYRQTSVEEIINVRTPSPDEAEKLDLTEDHRVFELVNITRTEDGAAVLVALHTMPVHLWELSYRRAADPQR